MNIDAILHVDHYKLPLTYVISLSVSIFIATCCQVMHSVEAPHGLFEHEKGTTPQMDKQNGECIFQNKVADGRIPHDVSRMLWL